MDDVILLSRLQFAVAVFFHFIFVPLTLGLSLLIALMETRYVRTGDEVWRKHAKFWGKLFIINFTLGVVTGITLEFQFGTNWARYSEYVGDIFGSLLAIEATVAFFLESTFLAVWHFGWHRVGKKTHLLAIWLVVLAGNLITGSFKLGFELQPIAHSSQLWNLLGMVLVGWVSVLLGGCPLRQLILAGEGNGDSAVTVFGMIVGAAFAHNFGLAGNADAMNEAKEIVVGGLSNNGKAAVCLGILIMLGVSLWSMPKAVSAPVEAAK